MKTSQTSMSAAVVWTTLGDVGRRGPVLPTRVYQIDLANSYASVCTRMALVWHSYVRFLPSVPDIPFAVYLYMVDSIPLYSMPNPFWLRLSICHLYVTSTHY